MFAKLLSVNVVNFSLIMKYNNVEFQMMVLNVNPLSLEKRKMHWKCKIFVCNLAIRSGEMYECMMA